jgi:hypothetical protein
MKLVEFLLAKIGHGDDTIQFLPADTEEGSTIIIKKDNPDFSGAYKVVERAYGDQTIIVNQEDII